MANISNGGIINEDIYDNILECILKGRCPHVVEVPSEYLRYTSVQALHIAAAADTVLKNPSDLVTVTGIFELYPVNVAMCHESLKFVRKYLKYSNNVPFDHRRETMWFARAMPGKDNMVICECFTESEVCTILKNRQLLKLVLGFPWTNTGILKAFRLCLVDPELAGMLDDILEHLRKKNKFSFQLSYYAISAIANDNDSALEFILDCMKNQEQANSLETEVLKVCDVLGKERQKGILSEYGFCERNLENEKHLPLSMLHYLRLNHADSYLEQIKAAFDALSTKENASIDIQVESVLMIPLYCSVDALNPRDVETLLNVGANVDAYLVSGCVGPTVLTHFLDLVKRRKRFSAKNFHEVLMLLVCANPDTELNIYESIVEHAITVDELFMISQSDIKDKLEFSGLFELDGKEHYMYVDPFKDGYELNFIAPLLIECGFSYSRNVLSMAFGRRLHAKELEYFRTCLTKPRSLKLSCRITLRKHFKNRRIHELISLLADQIPKYIQDFILLKDVLKNRQNYLA